MTLRASLHPLARAGGGLTMVAMDQRASLRTMFAEAGVEPTDETVVQFKLDVAAALGPLASGFLIDRGPAFDSLREGGPAENRPNGVGLGVSGAGVSGAYGPGPGRSGRGGVVRGGLILAADALTQQSGEPVEETAIDEVVLAPDYDLDGVAAVKLLIIWRRDDRREHRLRLVEEFIACARRRGVLSVLEPVVRATPAELGDGSWDADAAIREAARELSALAPDLYKAQVPRAGVGPVQDLQSACDGLGRSIQGPWVVLSQGVERADFRAAVEAACRGGASGFLAGRALWSDVVGVRNVPAALAEVSVPRLERLIETVDREARPWSEA